MSCHSKTVRHTNWEKWIFLSHEWSQYYESKLLFFMPTVISWDKWLMYLLPEILNTGFWKCMSKFSVAGCYHRLQWTFWTEHEKINRNTLCLSKSVTNCNLMMKHSKPWTVETRSTIQIIHIFQVADFKKHNPCFSLPTSQKSQRSSSLIHAWDKKN